MENNSKENKHFVLVHGACHGAWCWFKLKPRLEAAGHRVTALDLAASGLDKREIVDVGTMHEYTKPLLELLETKVGSTSEEKVILIGHSLGGISLSLAMEMFPEKISVAVFLTAFMPDTVHQPSYVLDEYNKRTPSESWLDTRFLPFNCYDKDSETSMIFGPKFLSEKLYQLCSPEDIALADMLMRPSSLFGKSLSRANKLTEKGFGSVKRAFIVCEEDQAIPKDYQLWMINNNPVDEVTIMEGVDHTPMLSNPQALSLCLLDIALKHA